MHLDALLRESESAEIASEINIASGFRPFLDTLVHLRVIKPLVNELRHSPTNKEVMYSRLMVLLTEQDDPGYAHPYDPAIAVYLYVLYCVDENLALKVAAQFSADPQLWWSRRLANYIIESRIRNQVKVETQSQSMTRNVVIAAPSSIQGKHQKIVYNTPTTESPIPLSYISDTARMVS